MKKRAESEVRGLLNKLKEHGNEEVEVTSLSETEEDFVFHLFPFSNFKQIDYEKVIKSSSYRPNSLVVVDNRASFKLSKELLIAQILNNQPIEKAPSTLYTARTAGILSAVVLLVAILYALWIYQEDLGKLALEWLLRLQKQ